MGVKTVALSLVVVVAVGTAALAFYRPDRALETAVGMVAHDLCSETFVAGLDPEQTFAESIRPRPGIRWIASALRHEVDREHREARSSFAGVLPMRAIHREGLGCVLVHDNDETVRAAKRSAARAAPPPLLPEIAGDAIVAPATPTLAAALDAAFTERDADPHRWTKAVVIVHEGRVVAERYAPGYGISTPILGFSMTKSVTNALVGILVREKRLDVGQPARVEAWKSADDPRHAVTLEQLMRMDSGLDLDETGTGFDPSNQMFYDEADMAAYAQRAQPVAAPATRWSYSSASTHLVSRIVRDEVGGTGDAAQRFAFEELFDLLGMHDVTLETDATGTPIGAHYMFASARDWARFGSLYLDDGMVGGRRVLPEGWVAWSTTPTLDSAYGAGWWTNRGDDPAARHRVEAGIPPDAFFAFGNLGQRIAVIPSERLVIVRMARAHLPFGDMAGFERLVVATLASLHETGR